MRGVVAPVLDEWLELVEREEPENAAVPRVERAEPTRTEPGGPWFLASARPAIVARGAFVEHELLTPAEAFERFGYGSGALSVEHMLAQLPAAELDAASLLGSLSPPPVPQL